MEKLGQQNPTAGEKTKAERQRIPMSVPVQKLEVPEIPGYHLHWFRGDAARIQRALSAGYEFVDTRDVKINNVGLGGDSAISGNTDMGSQVSIASGDGLDGQGQPNRLILMKIKQEWFEEDQAALTDRNEQVAVALNNGVLGAEKDGKGDTRQRYVDKSRTQIPDLFKRKG